MIDFKNEYSKPEFIGFLKDFLPDFQVSEENIDVNKKFRYLKSLNKIGQSKTIDVKVFEIDHESENDPRVSLSKESFILMKELSVSKALIVFKNSKSKNYRFSLITFESRWDEGTKIKTEFSNPRRYSFFLGPNAKVKTPNQFLIKNGLVKDIDDLKSRFSIEVVNKQFYNEISYAFKKLIEGMLKIPDSADKSHTNLEFAVRLIGRIIFCWFLKEKKNENNVSLVPKDLLSLEAISEHGDYYHNILEPIFFEILNKPIKERVEKFTEKPYSTIPYLNGGLFSPEKDDFYKRGIYQSDFYNNLVIPDEWLKEFFTILETYNFTIDENTSYDEELSIDPEMLGRIFENLLAEINPETGESARKSTGSYYTPRIIVDYMVDESLLLYLKQQTEIKEEKLKAVISYELTDDDDNPLTLDEREKIVNALEKVKILDPACGSGAFPIGALQKIVFMLQQVDPDGSLWFRKQLAKASPEFRKDIEKKFSNKEFDFLRKLGVIRECIYGVDIQPIATEISRLRCFLTLIVDEHIDDNEENRGIKPLPNLDFKFVTANSLIGLPTISKNEPQQPEMFDDRENIDELKNIRDQYFTSSGIEREKLKLEFSEQQKTLIKQMYKEHGYIGMAKSELTQKLTDWEPFTHKRTDWFDPEWMFGIKEGFDIVIANPPYLRVQGLSNEDKNKFKKQFKSATGAYDLYLLFTEKGFNFLNKHGTLCHIMPDKWVNGALGLGLRKIIGKHLNKLISFKQYQVFNASTYSSLIWLKKETQNELSYAELDKDLLNNDMLQKWLNNLENHNYSNILNDSLNENAWVFSKPKVSRILQKILLQPRKMTDVFEKIFQGIATSKDSVYFLSNCRTENEHMVGFSDALNREVKIEKGLVKPLLMGDDIHRYIDIKTDKIVVFPYDTELDTKGKPNVMEPEFIQNNFPMGWQYFIECEELIKSREKGRLKNDKGWYRYIYPKNINLFNKQKLICPYISNKSQFTFDELGNFYTNTKVYGFIKKNDANEDYKFLLAMLNSSLVWFYMSNVSAVFRGGYYVYAPIYINNFAIPKLSFDEQEPFIKLVDQILELKRKDSQTNTLVIEKEIDQMVYKLYDLKPEEIKIVEGN